jgi:hypothetical protein
MARKNAYEIFNIIEFVEGEEVEVILTNDFIHTKKDDEKEKFIVYEGYNSEGEIIQFFGAGLLTSQIEKVKEKMKYPCKIWINYKGKKEVNREVSPAGYVNDFLVEYDDETPDISEFEKKIL